MFTTYSNMQSNRTIQEVVRILSGGQSEQQGSIDTGGKRKLFSNTDDNSSTDEMGIPKPPSSVLSAHISRKPGSRLGLKRVLKPTDLPTAKKLETEKNALPAGTRCFNVLFGKPQTKKNKTWDDDGFLLVTRTTLTLRDTEGEIVSCTKFNGHQLNNGSHFHIGEKIVQIENELNQMPSCCINDFN